jgi:formylglycine-generating enzyme required for sulfatase activity
MDRPTKVGSYPTDVSPYAVMDMAGNVSEWTTDWYSEDYYRQNYQWNNPTGPASGTRRVVRGGNWMSGGFISPRTSQRWSMDPLKNGMSAGFRCVLNNQ